MNKVIHGYCEEELVKIPTGSIDLVITSPPYANQRKGTYGGITAAEYVVWFMPIAAEIYRVLKPTGSFLLNIKPHTSAGERSLYVFDLVLALRREVGFLFVDEFAWIKNAFPGALKGRFKNGFEPVYHFTKSNPSTIKFNPLACGTPVKPESVERAYRKQCGPPKNGSGMAGIDATNLRDLELARPSNVIHAHNVSNQHTLKSEHSATFPEALVAFFVKSFTDGGDVVLDCFAGSGTVGVVCTDLGRDAILIEKEVSNIELINKRLTDF